MKGTVLGILLLAHGGNADWNAQVKALRDKVDAKVPCEVALGMADPETLQAGLDALEKRGVTRVAAVPLFVQSRSEVLDQTAYALGLAAKPSEVLRRGMERMMKAHAGRPMPPGMRHMMGFSLARVKTALPVVLTPALDDDALVSSILLERAKALSRDPKTETVVLVAHGPVDDAALAAWTRSLSVHAAAVRRGGGFRAAFGAVLRDDAAPSVRASSVGSIRRIIGAASTGGKALVVPVLIARGGIEGKLPKDLEGLDYAWSGDTLMPHDGFDEWVLKRAREATERP